MRESITTTFIVTRCDFCASPNDKDTAGPCEVCGRDACHALHRVHYQAPYGDRPHWYCLDCWFLTKITRQAIREAVEAYEVALRLAYSTVRGEVQV